MKEIERQWGFLALNQSLRLDFDYPATTGEYARARFTYEDGDLPVLCLAKRSGWEKGELRLVVSPRRARINKPANGSPTRISINLGRTNVSYLFKLEKTMGAHYAGGGVTAIGATV